MKNVFFVAVLFFATPATAQTKSDSLAHATKIKWEDDSSAIQAEIGAHRAAIKRYKSEPDSYFTNLTKMWKGKKIFTRQSMIAHERHQIELANERLVHMHEQFIAHSGNE